MFYTKVIPNKLLAMEVETMRLWLKEIREENNLTQLKLSEKTGITEQYVYMLETGERRPSVDIAKKIAEILGFEWTRFFEGT